MFSKMLYSDTPYYEFSEHQLIPNNPTHHMGIFENDIYNTDEFRMYSFKIKRCPRTRSHDWTICPFAHRGEKAMRRDPRIYDYAAVSCPDYRDGTCLRGDICPYAHGVFEYWLHPAKYRTRACNSWPFCERKVCFFAHAPEELRDESIAKRQHMYRLKTNDKDEKGKRTDSPDGATSPGVVPATTIVATRDSVGGEGTTDFLASLSGLTICEKDETETGVLGNHFSPVPAMPKIDWIAELVK